MMALLMAGAGASLYIPSCLLLVPSPSNLEHLNCYLNTVFKIIFQLLTFFQFLKSHWVWLCFLNLWYFFVDFCFPGPKDLLSDRCILSCPSMDLVTCLLDFRLNFASNRSIVPRLAASLAACAQLSALGTSGCPIKQLKI